MRSAGRLGIVTIATVVLVFVGGAGGVHAWSEQPGTDDRGSSCAAAGGCPADPATPGGDEVGRP